MIENGRIVCNRCERACFDYFIKKIQSLPNFLQKGHRSATQSALQERYSFACGKKNISIVYETNSETLVITAAEPFLPLLKAELEQTKAQYDKALQQDIKPDIQSRPSKMELKHPIQPNPLNQLEKKNFQHLKEVLLPERKNPQPLKEQKLSKEVNSQPIREQKQLGKINIKPIVKQKRQEEEIVLPQKKLDEKITIPKKSQKPLMDKSIQQSQSQKSQPSEELKRLDDLYKNGYAIKKYQPEKLENVIKNIKSLKGVSCRQTSSEEGSQNYQISDSKNKVYLRYIDSKNTLQLQGRRSKLFGEIQVLVSQGSDYVTAVSSHIDLTGEEKRARDMEKRLKKLLPNAFDFLSEQSRIDLTIGMIDIGNDEVKLSDYSMLLVPPYRGLERLIYDLQRLKSIDVKMIGQAYEKTSDGDYTLKIGYKRKINSIIYAEVMSALYTEYFAKRNFYAHSDITGDLLSRVITEKSAVKEIFNRLTQIIEYNITKLKEIGLKI